MTSVVIKAAGIWVVLVVVAIFNGILREHILIPLFGQKIALPLSGVCFCMLIFGIILITISYLHATVSWQYWVVGSIWVLLTLAFELVFGRFVMGKTWRDVFDVFNVLKGDLMTLVLITTAVSPYLTARMRGLI